MNDPLDNENEICQDFPDFPKEMERAVGGLFFESPLICGGAFYDGHHSSNECQVLNANSKQSNWQTFGTLSKNRTFAGKYASTWNPTKIKRLLKCKSYCCTCVLNSKYQKRMLLETKQSCR